MGYIAPITNFQYMQYAERVIGKRYDPYRFVPIANIKPSANPEENDQSNLLDQPLLYDRSKRYQEAKQQKDINKGGIEKLYSEITGKGRYFSEYA
ncbi:hypothetical protein ACFYKT_15975 [Cytobacillus sp. FJAT-53684]|uniref:Uncharacterized protein n=1 Tax=Cytobacillus mangrovibacter TaxID=3299024 RepID=A0ABW6K281_9BACI